MIKYVAIIAVFFAVQAFLFFSLWLNQRDEVKRIESENNSLISQIEEFNNAEIRANNTIQKIQEKIKYVKEPCDCFNSDIPYDLLDWVRGNKK